MLVCIASRQKLPLQKKSPIGFLSCERHHDKRRMAADDKAEFSPSNSKLIQPHPKGLRSMGEQEQYKLSFIRKLIQIIEP